MLILPSRENRKMSISSSSLSKYSILMKISSLLRKLLKTAMIINSHNFNKNLHKSFLTLKIG